MSTPVRVALVGLGVIGSEVYRYYQQNKGLVEVVKICVRDRGKARQVEVPADLLTDDMADVWSENPTILIEVSGRSDAVTEVFLPAFDRRIHVVTAHKSALSSEWARIVSAARDAGCALRMDAAVGGGIPVVRIVHDQATLDEIGAVGGVLNGTSNFVLWYLGSELVKLRSRTRTEKLTLEEALREAERRGLREPGATLDYRKLPEDPDLNGADTRAKLVILANLAFSSVFDPVQDVSCTGIVDQHSAVSLADIYFASSVLPARGGAGWDIKLVGQVRRHSDGPLTLSVQAHLVPSNDSLVPSTTEERNGVFVKAARLQLMSFYGFGAGPGPTSINVASGVNDIATRARMDLPRFHQKLPLRPMSETYTSGIIRSYSTDQTGVFATKHRILSECGINVEASWNIGGNRNQAPEDLAFEREHLIETDNSMPDYILIDSHRVDRVEAALAALRDQSGVSGVRYFPFFSRGG